MSRIRSFVAVPTPPMIIERIMALMTDLRSVPSDVKWEHAEKLHITLKFLGSMEESDLQSFSALLSEKARTISPFEYAYEGIGAFPNLEHPRVYWVGTSDARALIGLNGIVEQLARRFSVAQDDRPFHPHVTIGRAKGSRGINLLTARVKSLTFEPVAAHCSEILLMKSDLEPTGSRYSVLSRIPFIL